MELSFEQAANLAELLGVILLIISIFYLTIQVRQANKAMRIQTVHDLSAMYIQAQSSLAQNEGLMAIYQRALSNYDGLDPLEQGRFSIEVGALMRCFNDLHYQHLQGTLDDDEWSGFKAVFDDLLSYSGFQRVWELRKHHHSEAFQQYVESILRTTPSRDAGLYVNVDANRPE